MEIKQEIIKAADSIRKKYKILRKGRQVKENASMKYFEPLVKPLQTLVDLTKNPQTITPEKITPKVEGKLKKSEPYENVEIDQFNEGEILNQSNQTVNALEIPFDESLVWSYEGYDEAESDLWQKWQKRLENYGPLTREYLTKLWIDTNDKFDYKFGVRPDPETNTWRIGNIEINFDRQDNIHIENHIFRGTPGLFELLFKKLPDSNIYTEEDLKIYKEILLASDAHLQKYDKNRQIAGSSGVKYRAIISKLFSSSGRGFLPVTNNQIDYLHWNDINELVERLFLLKTAQRAGHSGVDIEINSIEQELREEGVIE